MAEYEEMIALKTNKTVAENVINALVDSDYVEFVDPQFHLRLIETDPDDTKFVDCAFAANATFIVSNDKHFDILKDMSFPKISVLKLLGFLKILK